MEQVKDLLQENQTNQPKLMNQGADLWNAIRKILEFQNQSPPLVPISREHPLPQSFAQARLWLLEQLCPNSAAYNIPFAFQIAGTLNLAGLEYSLNEIIRRHEALRTTFAEINGEAVQIITSSSSFPLPIIDLQQLPSIEKNNQAIKLITEAARQSFDLSQAPLLRACVFKLAEDEHILLLTVHHIAFDGWSEGILLHELSVLYQAYITETPPSSLVELPIQYADFSVWQQEWLQGEFLDLLQTYWKQQLDGQLTKLPLPLDTTPEVPIRQSQLQTLVLDPELVKALKALGRQEKTTLFVVLLSAFKVLLHCYTGQNDIFVCSPTANRNREELKDLIGYFVNLLVLRTKFSEDLTYRDLLTCVRQETSTAYAHQDLPIQQVVSQVDSMQGALSQIMFVLQNVPKQALILPGLTVTPLSIDNGTADFDLFFSLVEDANTITGVMKYNSDLFHPETIAQMLEHFQTLLENIVANPASPISQLLPLSQIEQETLQQKREKALLLPQNSTQNYLAPRNALELQLSKIWEKTLSRHPIGVRDNFFDLGGESLLALRLFSHIEQQLGKNLPLATLLQAPTIEQLARVLSQEEAAGACSPLVPIQTEGTKLPFFCVHGLYGNVLNFRPLAKSLSVDRPFYGVQARGVDGQQAPFSRIEDMAAYYIEAIQTVQPQGPYFLGGYSLGGIIAFEMAQQLQVQGQEVALLALMDCYNLGTLKQLSLWGKISHHTSRFLQRGPNYILKKGRKFIQRKLGKTVNQLAPTLETSLPQNLLRLSLKDAHKQAEQDYRPTAYRGKITLFRATEPPGQGSYYQGTMPKPTMPEGWFNPAPQHCWVGLANGGLEIHDVAGDHWSMLDHPHVESLAEKLRASLN